MHLDEKYQSFTIGLTSIDLRRAETGLIEIAAENDLDFQKALGFVHAHDRITQMLTLRALGRGRLSEVFSTSETLQFDTMARKLHFYNAEKPTFDEKTKSFADAYCEGVNTYLENNRPPLLTKLYGEISPWETRDILTLIKMNMYLGMAQTQERVEKFIIQAVQEGVSLKHLKKLFHPHLEGLSEEVAKHIRETRLEEPFLKTAFHPPAFSNNWVISSKKSDSNFPYMCCDPHLVINHLPSFWYEVAAYLEEDYRIGITIPGIPSLIMGRSQSLTASLTYGMMDTIDLFIEECKNGHYRRGDEWVPIQVRREEIKRRGRGAVSLSFHETDLGVIESKGRALEDGKYFCLSWSSYKTDPSSTLRALSRLWESQNVLDAQKALKECEMSCNWLLADREGNIGYQQTGRLPLRAHSGLFPMPAWIEENRWKGVANGDSLKSVYNPESGFLYSANDDQNQEGKPLTINVPFANYRARRIRDFLSKETKMEFKEVQSLQSDLYSYQAADFMQHIREFIPETRAGEILKNWDLHYDIHSQGATLFEAFYTNVSNQIFGKEIFGDSAWQNIASTSLHFFLHGNFDAFVLQERKEELKTILLETLAHFEKKSIPEWGKQRIFWMKHVILGKTATRLLRKDAGPFILPGSFATVALGHFFREKKRPIVVGASYRFSTDLSNDLVESALAGGSREEISSPFFASDTKKWANFEYKMIDGKKFNALMLGLSSQNKYI